MSFDLGVFYTKRPHSDEDAGERYAAYCDGGDLAPWIEPSPKVAKFLKDLTGSYPQIDDVKKKAIDDCPWSCAFDVSKGHVLMPMVWSRADEMAPIIVKLAKKHGLVCFNPQQGKIVAAPSGIRVEARETTSQDIQRDKKKPEAPFAALLDEILEPRGFLRHRHRWQKNGKKSIVTFELGNDSGIVEVSFCCWFKALGRNEVSKVRRRGEFHLLHDLTKGFLPRPLTFRLMRAFHLDIDYADFAAQAYAGDEEVAKCFKPRRPLTMNLRLNTLREAMELHVLPFVERVEAGDHKGIFADEQAKEEQENFEALETEKEMLKAAAETCRKLHAEGVGGREFLDAIKSEVNMVSEVALVLCIAFRGKLSEAKAFMEGNGMRWSGLTQEFAEEMIEAYPFLVKRRGGKIELL